MEALVMRALFAVRLRAQIVKEFLSVLRDPRTRAMLFVLPVVQLLVFAYAITLDVKNVSIAVLNRDTGRWGVELTEALRASGFVGEMVVVHDSAALHEQVNLRRALLSVEVPQDFSRNIAAGRSATVQVIVDGRRANAGQIAFGYVQGIATRLGARAYAQQPDTDPVALRHWFNPNLMPQWFVVPNLCAVLSMILGVLLTALSVARERELGTFEQLMVSPATALEIIISKTIPALCIASALGMGIAAVGILGFGVPFSGSLWVLAAAVVLFILSVVGVGLMISSVSHTQQQAILGTFAMLVPMVLLSGFATPVENMPEVLQWLAELNPLKHILVIIRGLYLKGMPFTQVLRNAWPMAAIAAVTLGMAAVVVRRRLQ